MTIPRGLRALLALAAAGSLGLSACSAGPGGSQSGNASAGSQDAPLVLTTFTVLQDMAANVAGDHLRVESITKPGAEIHDYEPTPSDITKVEGADLILNNGLGLERWFEKFVADSDAPRVDLSEGIAPIDISEGDYSGKPNPHAWMSPANGQIYVDNIARAFTSIDPDHAADYQANATAYKQKIQSVADSLEARLEALPDNERTLVSCEGAFSYLTRDVGLNEVYLWPVNSETEGPPQQIASVVDKVAADRVPAVFCESTVNTKAMQQVADETGAAFRTDADHLLYVDSLSEADGPVPSYLDLLQHDADAIASGLTGQGAQ